MQSTKPMTFDEYLDSVCQGGRPDAGYWNRAVDYLKDECDPVDIGEDGETYYRIVDLEAAEDYAKEYLAS